VTAEEGDSTERAERRPAISPGEKPMSKGKKIALGIVLALLALVLLLVVLVPLLVDLDRYRPQVVALLQEETGKPAQIGHLALTVFPSVSIRVDDFTLGNPPAFPQGDFAKVRRVYAVVDAGALWDRRVVIKSLELNDPSLNLLSDARGHWNFENPPKPPTTKKTSSQDKPLFSLGVISKVSIKGGQLTVADALSSGKAGPAYVEVRGFSSQLQQVDLNAFIAASSGALSHPPSPLFAAHQSSSGLSLLYAAAPQPQPAAQGTLKADAVRFQRLQATSVKSKLRLFPKQAYLDDLSLDLCGGRTTGGLSFNFAGANLRYATNARLTGVDMAKLLEAFPDLKGKMTGKMDGNAKISGEVPRTPEPLAGVRGTGQVTIRNGQLPSLQLNKNLMLLARLSNLGSASGDPSSFSSLAADFNIANQQIASNKITLVGNGVDVDGSGTLSVAGAGSLNYQGVASIAAGQNAISNLLAGFSGAKQEGGKLTFPFALAGTLANPKFSLKSLGSAGQLQAVGGLLGAKGGQGAQPGQTQQQNPANVVQGISELFKKKKQTQPPPK
jgi:AsmA protein